MPVSEMEMPMLGDGNPNDPTDYERLHNLRYLESWIDLMEIAGSNFLQ